MPRKIGDKDIGRRKQRSDKGKHHSTYRGKKLPKIRSKKHKYTPSRKGHKTHLKLWIWERKKMSAQGLKNWKPHMRGKVKKEITKFGDRIDSPVSELTNSSQLRSWSEYNIGKAGKFIVMGFSHGKNRYHLKPVKLFEVSLTNTKDGLRAQIIKLHRIYRFWFWGSGSKG